MIIRSIYGGRGTVDRRLQNREVSAMHRKAMEEGLVPRSVVFSHASRWTLDELECLQEATSQHSTSWELIYALHGPNGTVSTRLGRRTPEVVQG